MAGIFPDGSSGGLIVRDPATGLPVEQPNVEGVANPPAEFTVGCDYRALPDDCNVMPENRQVNAIVSEMLMLAAIFDPDGTWDCTQYDNLAVAFQDWVSNFQSSEIGGQICSVAESDGLEAAASLLYCANAVAYKLPIVGPTSLSTLLQNDICQNAVTGATDNVNDFLIYCRNGVFRKVAATTYQWFVGEWFANRTYSTNHMVRRLGRLWSPNATIPAGTAFVVGTSGLTWYEVSPNTTEPYDPDEGYAKDTLISKDGLIYAANDDIPPGTPFVIGTTGQTWRQVDFSQAFILPHSNTTAYAQYSVVTYNGAIYRATIGPVAAGAFNPAQWELISGENSLYRGPWLQSEAYDTTHLVQRNDKLWSPNAAIPAGTAWAVGTSGATWREISPSASEDFDPANAYQQDTVIQYQSAFYAANEDIPAGTPFAVGLTGATWRQVTLASTMVLQSFSPTKAYAAREAVVYPTDGSAPMQLWRAKSAGHAAGPWNVNDFEQISSASGGGVRAYTTGQSYAIGDVVYATVSGYIGQPFFRATQAITNAPATLDQTKWALLVEGPYILKWDPARAYVGGQVAINPTTGGIYTANGAIPAGTATFTTGYTGATWRPMEHLEVPNALTGTAITLGPGHENSYLRLTSASPKTVTIPTNVAWNCAIGTVVAGESVGGQTTIVGASGVTLNSASGTGLLEAINYAGFCLVKSAADVWTLHGRLTI